LKKSEQNYPPNLLTKFFFFASLEGILCLIILLSLPPDPQTAWFLGYSRNRVILLVVALLGVFFFSYLAVMSDKKYSWAGKLLKKITDLISQDKYSIFALGSFLAVFVGGLVYLFCTYSRSDYIIPQPMIATVELIRTYMGRLVPFVIWMTLFSAQSLLFLTLYGNATKDKYYRVLRIISITVFPVLLVAILITRKIDPDYYYYINKEDKLVEWLTFSALLIAGILSIIFASRNRKHQNHYYIFFIIFGIVSIVLAMEEISWGQRIFELESGKFFLENSDQQEINAHNVVNKWFNVRTKHVAAFILFIYGVCLPFLAINSRILSLFEKLRIVVPPLFLSLGFSLGSFLTLNIFSGVEEEIAEGFLSLCLLLFIISELLKASDPDRNVRIKSQNDELSFQDQS